MLIVNQLTDETMRVLDLIEATRDRIVIREDREAVMRLFLQISSREEGNSRKSGIRKLAMLLNFFFDFRRRDNPQVSLGKETLETELYRIKRELDGKNE